MAKDFVAFRPGKKAPDIIEDLGRYKNQSARIRELYRLGLAVERGEYVKAADIPKVIAPELSMEQVAVFREQWERAQHSVRPAPPPTVAYEPVPVELPKDEEDDILRNILGGFD